eukprot:Rhum_TRINITY_DN9762_c1_g1::Rhum_TRINITY_DN9762_c1_g1_i1::g.35146::m.35146
MELLLLQCTTHSLSLSHLPTAAHSQARERGVLWPRKEAAQPVVGPPSFPLVVHLHPHVPQQRAQRVRPLERLRPLRLPPRLAQQLHLRDPLRAQRVELARRRPDLAQRAAQEACVVVRRVARAVAVRLAVLDPPVLPRRVRPLLRLHLLDQLRRVAAAKAHTVLAALRRQVAEGTAQEVHVVVCRVPAAVGVHHAVVRPPRPPLRLRTLLRLHLLHKLLVLPLLLHDSPHLLQRSLKEGRLVCLRVRRAVRVLLAVPLPAPLEQGILARRVGHLLRQLRVPLRLVVREQRVERCGEEVGGVPGRVAGAVAVHVAVVGPAGVPPAVALLLLHLRGEAAHGLRHVGGGVGRLVRASAAAGADRRRRAFTPAELTGDLLQRRGEEVCRVPGRVVGALRVRVAVRVPQPPPRLVLLLLLHRLHEGVVAVAAGAVEAGGSSVVVAALPLPSGALPALTLLLLLLVLLQLMLRVAGETLGLAATPSSVRVLRTSTSASTAAAATRAERRVCAEGRDCPGAACDGDRRGGGGDLGVCRGALGVAVRVAGLLRVLVLLVLVLVLVLVL